MKIALYLQDITIKGREAEDLFWSDMDIVAQNKPELLVFPENCFVPSENEVDYILINDLDADGLEKLKNTLRKRTRKVAERTKCPVIICHEFDVGNSETLDNEGMLSFYFNPKPSGNDTKEKIYLKHVATRESAFDLKPDYKTNIKNLFTPIVLNDFTIGHLICYDSSFPLFSRAYGLQGVDLIINSTGQHVPYKKWTYFQKVRAIENHCSTLCTMAHADNGKNKSKPKPKSFVVGYDLNGKKLINTVVDKKQIGKENIFIYEVSENHKIDYKKGDIDEYFDQKESESKDADLFITTGKIKSILNNYTIDKSYYLENNVLYVVLKNKEILKPEVVTEKIFSTYALFKSISLKIVLINFWDKSFEEKYFDNLLSNVLKVRCVENFCCVIGMGNGFLACYQPTMQKNVQRIKYTEQGFGVSLKRIGGVKSIWKDGDQMQKRWLIKYAQLWNYLVGANSDQYSDIEKQNNKSSRTKKSEFEIEILDAWMDKIKGVTYLRANICIEGLTATGDFLYNDKYVGLNDNKIMNDYFDGNNGKWNKFIRLLYKNTKAFLVKHGNGKRDNFLATIKKQENEGW